MPNGSLTKEEHEELERFFAPLAASLEAFAQLHGLKVDKYYHGGHSWGFLFLHPVKGTGKIQVRRHDGSHVQVHGMWWWDDYQAQTRHSRWADESLCAVAPDQVEGALEHMLAEFLSWDELTEATGGYTNWGRYAEAELEALAKRDLRLPR
jgi:hypothetical protein